MMLPGKYSRIIQSSVLEIQNFDIFVMTKNISMLKLNIQLNTSFIFATHDEKIMGYLKRIIYLEDGKISRIKHFNKGLNIETISYLYYDDGKIFKEMNFYNDEKDGEIIIYYNNGTIKKEEYYKDKHKVGEWSVYNEGGYKDGEWVIYYDDYPDKNISSEMVESILPEHTTCNEYLANKASLKLSFNR